ncbi:MULTISPECIES: hypothetical protein [Priestia]|uniref:hypothetical protein n=1 Tax=Priestia TaxID=2800373 RepID=UPI001455A3DB|nr:MULTISPECIES: hypothetical protein [Priestia]MED3954446.1 hypothetical protein [Priestia aryabhattai]NLR45595.1 hypothetical protein [Priestia megaterium]WDC87813.1 hypothetical protein PSR56_22745 [Priestia megaterium]
MRGKGKDSCRKSGSDEEVHRRPRKATFCTEINSGVTNDSYGLMHPICWPGFFNTNRQIAFIVATFSEW